MCGIVGVYARDGSSLDESLVERMRDSMVHRGPDDSGLWRSPGGHAVLGHRRLAIVDLTPAGRAPMANEDGSVQVTFNGEIYNHRQLRAELERKGHRFRSKCDTEVLVHLWEDSGPEMVKRLTGMFAFAIWDDNRETMFVARDRLGIKPLYWLDDGRRFACASEIKALLPLLERNEIDETALANYLTFVAVPPPRTLMAGIRKLAPATMMLVDRGGPADPHRYWDPIANRVDFQGEATDWEEALELRLETLGPAADDERRSGRRLSLGWRRFLDQCCVDVPSSSTTLSTRSASASTGRSSSMSFGWARRIASQFGTNHHEVRIDEEDMWQFLPSLVHHQDEPIADPVCVPVYFVAKLAKDNGVTVVHVGEGADELFAGYPTYVTAERIARRYWRRFRALPGPLRSLIGALGDRALGSNPSYEIHREALRRGTQADGHLWWGGAVAFYEQALGRVATPELWRKLDGEQPREVVASIYRDAVSAGARDELDHIIYQDLRLRLPELLLMRIDKLTMANAVEARVPFLDHELVELAMAMPRGEKIRDRVGKHVLKRAVSSSAARGPGLATKAGLRDTRLAMVPRSARKPARASAPGIVAERPWILESRRGLRPTRTASQRTERPFLSALEHSQSLGLVRLLDRGSPREPRVDLPAMRQLLQNVSTGELTVEEVPPPSADMTSLLVATRFSLISAGTERAVMALGNQSLLGKARARPDLVAKMIENAKAEGLATTYAKVRGRLSEPNTLGYSLSGTVLRACEGAPAAPGELVACAGAGHATHAEIVSVPRNLCARVPDGVTAEDAAYATVASIALHGVRLAEVGLGDVVAVIGLGLVGQLTLELAAAAGCVALGLDPAPTRVDLARAAGFFATSDQGELDAELRRLTERRGADGVLVTAASNSSEPVATATAVARERAVVCIVGDVAISSPRAPLFSKELRLVVSRSYGPGRYDPTYEERGIDYPPGYVRWTEGRNLAEALRLMASGKAPALQVDDAYLRAGEGTPGVRAAERSASRPLGSCLVIPLGQRRGTEAGEPQSPSRRRPTSSGRPRIGVIGAGQFARSTLIPHLQRGAEIVAIANATGASAKSAATRIGATLATTDVDELLSDERIDAVVIATRHDTHADYVARALQAGKHVFVEKPLALERRRAGPGRGGRKRHRRGADGGVQPPLRSLGDRVSETGSRGTGRW